MNLDKAYQIVDYAAEQNFCRQKPPREKLLEIVELMGYKKIKGVRRLSDATNRQLYRVALELITRAKRTISDYWQAIEKEAETREAQRFPRQYHTFLCDRLEIPKAERSNYTINDLEKALQQ